MVSQSKKFVHAARDLESVARDILKRCKSLQRNASVSEVSRELQNLQKQVLHEGPEVHHLINNLVFHVKKASHVSEIPGILKGSMEQLLGILSDEHDKAAFFASEKIRPGSEVLVFGTNDRMLHFIVQMLAKRRPAAIHLLDAHPFWVGKHWVRVLSELGIPIHYHAFAQVDEALRHVDVVFLGCEYVTSDFRVVTVVGSRALIRLAGDHAVPVYLCLHSWDYHPKASSRHIALERHDLAHKLLPSAHRSVRIDTSLHEFIDIDALTGIISEKGILAPSVWKTKAV